MKRSADFEHLTPEVLLDRVEDALGRRMTGLTIPLPSYINRVYELQTRSGERVIAKFYRPGRWSRQAIEDEHLFLADCVEAEIPVVPPLQLPGGGTLSEAEGTFFAIFPKKAGRVFELNADEDWTRMGSLLGRIHQAGARRGARDRITLHPDTSTRADLDFIVRGGFITPDHRSAFEDLSSRIVEDISPLFEETGSMRIHGDFHRGNLLDRPGEGLMVIDFDDMMEGPPVHDLWLLLPDHAGRSRREIDLILAGYEQFREFDYSSLRLIECLRFMRIVYYLAWCARQAADYDFRTNHPDWGSDTFWQKELLDMGHQYQVIMEHKVAWEEGRFFGG
ncbi:MAG TPA: serine/threonine protein kinase [Deltaproteobacteria bacterium]|jgi:Ser/Thr protein kinase RdoA (MazF antagonist)|nr:serine/threonine protein kinase [Deltaproteobacteria bacterium]OQC27527.1 MAG: serine/threonine protein kinase [Deltaproteobacteria bacterium ADurb.Bin072]HRW80917.1 serine/threonine protein kinase [Desulfomonilia bacterium]NMD41542.1 serine/threonine protein kinase [Deltaproteobacteria bacterium]HNQ86639.1 serine/threonine protein kinase [Deltaproteobacteria bacterium]